MSCDRMRRALDFIEANIAEPIRLKQLADAAALSPFHFSRSFKKASGVAPMRYVLLCRIDAAKRILVNPNAQHSSIVFACGFASESHFCTAFKQAEGMTPCEYRRSLYSS